MGDGAVAVGLFSPKGTDGAKSDGKPGNTVSSGKWSKVQKAAAGQVDLVEGPWTDPKRSARKRAWNDARDNADSN